MTNPRHQDLWKLLLGVLLAPCGLCPLLTGVFYSTNALSAQSVERGTMFEIFDNLIVVFTLLAFVALLPNRGVELVKPFVDSRIPATKPNLRLFVVLALSLLFGLAVAFLLNLNVLRMFPENPFFSDTPHIAGVILTGVALMFDANVWHKLGEAIQRREEVVESEAEAARLKG